MAHQKMRRRVKFDWKISDFIFNLFSSLSCLFCWIKKRKSLNVKKRFELYEKGEEKFIKEFDAVQFAKSMRNLNTLVTSMMDDSERVMIKYQKCNVISLSSGDEGNGSDGIGKNEIPKLFTKNKQSHKTGVDNFMVWSQWNYF